MTDRPWYSVCNSRPHLSTVMWPNESYHCLIEVVLEEHLTYY